MNAARVLAWHDTAAWILIATNGIAGSWALASHYVEALRSRGMWIVVIVSQLMAFVMAFTGVLLVSRYNFRLDDMHALYGFSTVIAVGILYSYRKSSFTSGKEHLLYGAGCLFIMGLGLRNLFL